MISDNFVVGDNVYLNELKNFFFEVLGMMSITHYGAIGDGRYDNYGPLQVAIDDANRRHLNYLYVPYGLFRFRGELINRENITFVGNPNAKIFNDRTGEEIEIIQFGVNGSSCNCKLKYLESNLFVVDGSLPSLATGSYLTDAYALSINGTVVVPRGTPFYYDAMTNTFDWLTGYAKYEGGLWVVYSGPEPEPPTPPEEDEEVKSIIMLYNSTDIVFGIDGESEPSLGEGTYKMLFPTSSNSTIGTGLTADTARSRVVVGSGINYVRVSVNIAFSDVDTTYVSNNSNRTFVVKQKHGSTTGPIISRNVKPTNPVVGGPQLSCTASNIIVPVSEGDEFFLMMTGGADDEIPENNSGSKYGGFVTFEGLYIE